MVNSIEKQSLEELKQIEENLSEIKERTPTPHRAFLMGIFQGAGVIIGSLLMITLLGYFLSLFGVIPGFGDMAHRLQDAVDAVRR
jgi:hypothetical protein